MIKKYILISIGLSLMAGFLFFCPVLCFAQDSQSPIIEEVVILTPSTGGLAERETAELERQYRYEFRRKSIIFDSKVDTAYTDEPSITGIGDEYLSDEEKLYRYFGVASVMRKTGRLGEAAEIIQFIASKRPDDRYVKNVLEDLRSEIKKSEKRWKKTSKKDAILLRKIKLKEFKEEGINSYKRKEYGTALLKFYNILAIDPGNKNALDYMSKLEKHYAKETHIESMIRNWETETSEKPGVEAAANEFLDRFVQEEDYDSLEDGRLAQLGVDSLKIEQLILREKSDSLLNIAEQDYRIQEIIYQKKREETRSRHFTVGPGDELEIRVRDHPELSGRTIVRPEGVIIMPLINDAIVVEGLTLKELRKEVVSTLERYVQDPVVYAGIRTFKSKVFYVIDESGATPYNITRMNITLRDALFIADWGNNRALGRVLVIKPHKIHPIVKKIDAFDIVYRGNLSKNIKIEDGDVIYIPRTAAARITDWVSDSLSPVKAVKDIKNEWVDQRWNRNDGWRRLFSIPVNREDEISYKQPLSR